MLRVLPKRFYGFGLAITIANTFLPMTANSTKRVALAMRMRGQPYSSRRLAIPVLEESLERSVDLSASLESRGFGSNFQRVRYKPDRWSRDESLAISGLVLLLAIYSATSISTPTVIFFFGLFALTPIFLSAESAL
jgi:energy-coupling factor transport system permease protein